MKNILVLLIGVISSFLLTGCCQKAEPEIRYITVYETKPDTNVVIQLANTTELLRRTQDSLRVYKDSINGDLFDANYKLERIRYYNNIAANGNNIKFLRGWINRVLNDN